MPSRLGSRLRVRWPVHRTRPTCASPWRQSGIWRRSLQAGRRLLDWLPEPLSSKRMIVRRDILVRPPPSKIELDRSTVSARTSESAQRPLSVAFRPDVLRQSAPAIDPLLPAAVFSPSDRSTLELDVRWRRREKPRWRQQSFAEAVRRSRQFRRRTAASDGHEQALPTHCCPWPISRRTTGLPGNLTFDHAAEKSNDDDSGRSPKVAPGGQEIQGEPLHPKPANSPFRPIAARGQFRGERLVYSGT